MITAFVPKLFMEIEIRDKLILDLNYYLVELIDKNSIIKRI